MLGSTVSCLIPHGISAISSFSPASGSAWPYAGRSSTLGDRLANQTRCPIIPLSLEQPLADGCLLPVPDHLPALTCPSSTALTTPLWFLVPASCWEKKLSKSECPPVYVLPLPCTMSSDTPNYRLEANVIISPISRRVSGAREVKQFPSKSHG